MSEHPRMDRRARIREYKDGQRPMGVFVVRNTVSGRWLLGSSPDVHSMLNRQRAQLRMGAHPNKALQRDWEALGAHAFAFEIPDFLTPPENEPGYDPTSDLAALKDLWLDKLRASGAGGYDERPTATGTTDAE